MSMHPTSSEHQALHDSATRFLAGLADFARQRQRQQASDWRLDRALWHQFGHLGWLGVMMPEAYGGLGLPAGDALTIMQAMGAHFVPEPYAASLAAAQLLQDLGSTAQQARWLPRVCTGTALLLPAHAEPGAGYALACVQTHAQSVGDGFCLEGRKSALPWGPNADGWLVSARSAGAVGDAVGISLFVLERGTPGLRWEQPATGIAGEPVADLILEGVQVPADVLLGELGQAWAALEAAHELLLAAACAEAVGTLQAVLDASCEYARTRRQFGVALSSFQVIAHRLVDMFTQVQLAHSMADLAAATLAQAGPQRHLRLAACKAQISAACRFVGEQAVQIHGGIGMTDELALSHQVRRLLAIDRRLGDRFHHLGVLAASVQGGAGLYGVQELAA